jgi:hypothetical protein
MRHFHSHQHATRRAVRRSLVAGIRNPQYVIRTVTESTSGRFRYVSSELVGPFPSVDAAAQWHAARNTRRRLSDGMVEPFHRYGAPVTSPDEWQPATPTR